MGGPAGSIWNRDPDADLGSLYSFLDVQHMRGGRASSFYGNLIVFLVDILLLSGIFRWKKKNRKNVCDIRTDDQQKMDPEKELLLFGILTVFVTWMMFYVFT